VAGIVFFRTTRLAEIADFYTTELGMELWLDQGACKIFAHQNLLLGFCESLEAESCGIVTLFYPLTTDVDLMYEKFFDSADAAPRINARYNIYQFFAKDPEGRTLEFQTFLHPLKPLNMNDIPQSGKWD